MLFNGFEVEPFVAFLSTLELCVLCSCSSQGLFLREGLTLLSVLPVLGLLLSGAELPWFLPAAALEHPV